jgi:multidrug efflux pump subunit AcrA (membrane-fusion protein)
MEMGRTRSKKKFKEKKHEEEVPTIATLSEEQLKIVGIKIGTIEQRELSATIKANGNLNVPNNNKANATTLYGGVIRTLKVQIGDYVRKG